MVNFLELLKQRCKENWLIGYDNNQFYHLTEEIYLNLQSSYPQFSKIIIAPKNSINFLAYFLALSVAKFSIFLGNHDWQNPEWEKVLKLVKPKLILGVDNNLNLGQNNFLEKSFLTTKNYIMIPTGGSSGNIKFAIHSWETLTNSVIAFQKFFNLEKLNFCCVLPLYHVSGLMQFLRCFLSGGNLALFDYDLIKKNLYPEINPNNYFISLVPTQLQFLLEHNPQWLAQFKTVLLGGAPASKLLLETARQKHINLALTYGMTETASGISLLKPEDFFKENHSNGQLLSHSKIEIQSNNLIKIYSDSLFLGYYPNLRQDKDFLTDDLGYIDENNYLYIIGRNSRKIISGGENIFPEEIEKEILATGLVEDICVIGIKDEIWGEVVTAIYVSKLLTDQDLITEKIRDKLSSYKIPKKWIQVTKIPRNKQDKINLNILKNY
jgi:O-succinylbenzoic acid--CoA ligase